MRSWTPSGGGCWSDGHGYHKIVRYGDRQDKKHVELHKTDGFANMLQSLQNESLRNVPDDSLR